MIDEVTLNANKPKEDYSGYAMLDRMNTHHKDLHAWALDYIKDLKNKKSILDVGFGGGQNIKNLSVLSPNSIIFGIDYSPASCKKCAELNAEEIQKGRVHISEGTAEKLNFKDKQFDLVTAFETIYYWPNIDICFKNIYNALDQKGEFLICNEDSSEEGNLEIKEALNMNFYSAHQLESLLKNAGFNKIKTFMHSNGKWVCAVAEK